MHSPISTLRAFSFMAILVHFMPEMCQTESQGKSEDCLVNRGYQYYYIPKIKSSLFLEIKVNPGYIFFMFFLHIYSKQPDGFEGQWNNRGGPIQDYFIHFLVMLVGKSLGDHFCAAEEVELSCSCLLTTEMKQIISMSNLLGKCCLLGLFVKCLSRSFNSWISPFLLNIWLLPNLVNLVVGSFKNTLLHALEISTMHCCGFLY